MPRVDLVKSISVERTPRVQQIEGMFDVPERKRVSLEMHVDVPLQERDWQIGLIVGPSGAGKSSIAKELFGDCIVDEYSWDTSKAIVDGFGETPIKSVAAALSSVGFSSPPAWVKPYHVLSTGEKFRANLARVLADSRPLLVVDEFTSVVDRTVGRIGAHAVAKAVRRTPGKRFVAVTCHEDVLEWLQPDWVLEPHLSRFEWRFLQRRPVVSCELVRVSRAAWSWFAPHHYLSAELNKSARCFAVLVDGKPAAFDAVLQFPHPKAKGVFRGHRHVVLPEFQGIGLGGWLSNTVGAIARANGKRFLFTTSHPAVIATGARSTCWRMRHNGLASAVSASGFQHLNKTVSNHRHTATFEYVGPAFADAALARQLWG